LKSEPATFVASGFGGVGVFSEAADVIKGDGVDEPFQFVKGEISGNLPAYKMMVQTFFKEHFDSSAPQHFKLFVGGHGFPNPHNSGDELYVNNCIDMWSLFQGEILGLEDQCFSVEEVQALFKDFISTEKPEEQNTSHERSSLQYVMTQCYSGGFHRISMSIDENGLPRKSANACGFTSAPEDLVASGCTGNVNGKAYDGYGRRMVEAITGASVVDETLLGAPQASLAKAHDEAMLLDDTPDVPLRSSEAYVLKRLAALSDKAKLPGQRRWTFLNNDNEVAEASLLAKLWKQVQANKTIEGASEVLNKDLERRLMLVDKLIAQFQKWNPEYKRLVVKRGPSDFANEQQNLVGILEAHQKETERLTGVFDDKFKKLLTPENVQPSFVEGGGVATDYSYFEELLKMKQEKSWDIFGTLLLRDPSLKLYARFMNYKMIRDNRIIDRAKENGNLTAQEATALKAELVGLKDRMKHEVELEKVMRQLQRIEMQMKVVATVAYFVDAKDQDALADLESYIVCESNAKFGE